MYELFSNTWFVCWYSVTAILMFYIQMSVFKKDIQCGIDVSVILGFLSILECYRIVPLGFCDCK